MEHLYPLFLNLSGKNCLIVGGGPVAERKAASLLEYGANIKIVSPAVEKEIAAWAEENVLTWVAREFAADDLDGAYMVFIATDDNGLNKNIADRCRQKGILVNAVDDPPNCDFFVPSVLRRDCLAVAISTEGRSPMFAARLRRQLESIITEEYGQIVNMLGQVRDELRCSSLDITQRKQFLEQLVDFDLLDLLQTGRYQEAEERINQCMSCLRD
jgi:precorrin-2 dehydrogenase/sirohydrochlorin ferrochelatase